MNQNKRVKSLLLRRLNKLELLLILLALPLFSAAQKQIVFPLQNSSEVLETLAQELDVKFNYSHDILSEAKHNFSASGSNQDILKVAQQKLKLQFVVLEENIYAVNKLPQELTEQDPNFSFTIKDEEGTTLPFCHVVLPELDLIFQSDEQGRCEIGGYFSDQTIVKVSYIGYQIHYSKIVRLRKTKELILANASHVLGEIVIKDLSLIHI